MNRSMYGVIITINMVNVHTESIITDESRPTLAYFGYSFLRMVSYSYVMQALCRLFLVIFHQH